MLKLFKFFKIKLSVGKFMGGDFVNHQSYLENSLEKYLSQKYLMQVSLKSIKYLMQVSRILSK